MEFFIAYQKLFVWYGKWRRTLDRMLHLGKKCGPYIPLVSVSYKMLLCLVTYFFSDFDSHSLSIQNYFGFALLYFILATLLGFDIFSILLVYCSKVIYNYTSLVASFTLVDIMVLDQIGIGLFTALVSIFLIQLKLSHVIGTWMEITLPLWIFASMGTVSLCFTTKYLLWKTFEKILLVLAYGYVFYSICLTCSLTALHFDNNPLLKSSSAGYYLIPLYPIFLGAIGLSVLKTFLTLRTCHRYFIQKRMIGMPFRESKVYGNVIVLVISSLGTLGALMMSFSVVTLCISCFMDNGENDSWDKAVFGIHFSPLVLVLLIVMGCIGFLTLFFIEGSFVFH
jgi:hypothetical protein